MITEQDGEHGFALHEEIKANELKRRELLVANINLLNDMRDKNFYRAVLGDEQGTWDQYLAQLEVTYSKNEIYTYGRIYDYFVKQKGINLSEILTIPKSRLYDIAVLNPEHVKDWLIKADTLISLDWNHEIREAKGLATEDDGHNHEMETFMICKVCGVKEKHNHVN